MSVAASLPSRGVLGLALLAAMALAGCGSPTTDSGGAPAPTPGAPVVVISIDTLRADHLPAYGYGGVATPAIDALRRDAILFQNAYSHVPLTLPSHVSLFTGLLPPEHGVRSNIGYRLNGAAHPTLARLLKAKGYATGAAVSAYVMRGATGLADGFDWYEDRLEGKEGGAEAVALGRRPGGETVRRALDWVAGVRDRPFLLFVHLYEPHFPYEPPEPYRSRYPLAYDGTIAAADAAVGSLLDGLRRNGTYDRALIVLLSDHGEGLGDHGELEHGILLYREALHVPLLVKLPGAKGGGTGIARPVGLVDLLPTIMNMLGVEPPGRQDGHDLFRPAAEDAGIYGETYYPRIHLGWSELRSLIDARHHYIAGPKPELYDITDDPGEKRPLSNEGGVTASMKQTLDASTGVFNEATDIDAEAAERLKSLGYLAGTVGPSEERSGSALPNPRDKIGTHERIKTLVREGRDEEAAAEFRRLLGQSPGLFDAQWELGVTLMRLGRPAEAVPEFEKAMRLSAALAPDVALALAEAQLQLGRVDAAEATARVGQAASPARAHALLARVALARRDAAGVEKETSLVKGDTAAEQGALATRADLLVQQGRLQEALALLDGARQALVGVGSRPFRGLDGRRGDILARLRRNDEAVAALRQEIANYPGNSQAYANLAVLSAVMGRPAPEVYGILDSMYRANPGRRSALLAADALDYLRKPQQAAEWRRRAESPPATGAR